MKYPWFKSLHDSKKFAKSTLSLINLKRMTMGKKSYELEDKIKKILNVKHVILTTSGTSSLMMATIAANLKPNDVVLAPNLTWVATTNPARIMGAKFILADTLKHSDKVCFKDLNKKIKKYNPKIVFLVHLNGQPNYNKEFETLKKEKKFFVIEDAAQAFLSKTNLNRSIGTKYDIGCFSLSITKPIHMVYGGFCTTNSNKLAEKLRAIRNNGVNAEPENARLELASEMGLNLKPSDLHSSIGVSNIGNLAKQIKKLKDIHSLYKNKISNKRINFLEVKGKYSVPCYNQVLVDNREEFIKFCMENSIGLNLGIRCLSETDINIDKGNYNNSLYLSKNLVRLPSGPGYNLKDISNIIREINKY
ncbi:aminotransferase class I/II-fold pyridoxal phosphate-dependent enzyme [Candidatus Pelagibacter ubique]|nr:aminotransferase class I/II-fold pyridoxal phosphate-dependent enzyme [Candidatus Pelagibacter ubique]